LPSKEKKSEEDIVFEFYDDDYAESLDVEIPKKKEQYNEVSFEDDLNDEQLEIINNLKGPMLVIAGAGSGKTRTIVYSVAKLLTRGVFPSEIMLVTFTNKAANEMVKRVEELLGKRPKGIWAGTFHGIANRFLRQYAKRIGFKTNYTIMDASDSVALMKLAMDRSDIKELGKRFPTSRMTKNILSYSINCNKSIQEVIQWKYEQFDDDKIEAKLKTVFKNYEKKKAEDNLVDFDDLIVYWSALLDERNIAKLLAQKIKYILVDEYQDTNYVQDDIINKIAIQNPQHNVMAVGDDAQSIYAFRGANFKNILEFEKKYDGCKVYKITYNYRSVPEILDLANDSLSHNKFQYEKEMKKTRKNGIKPYQVNVGNEDDQARFISNQILKLRKNGFELNEMAILYRAARHSIKIEVELRTKNIPYVVRAGLSFFEKGHIKDLLVHLRVIENPYDELSWSRIFKIVPGLGATSGAKIFDVILKTKDPIAALLDPEFFPFHMKGARIQTVAKKNLVKHVRSLKDFSPMDNPSEVILKLIKLIEDYVKTKYASYEDRLLDLKQLGVYAQNYPTIRKFLENLALNSSAIQSKTVQAGDRKEEEKPLVLSTIHRAKGLEWRVVFIPMLCEDLFPSSRVYGDPDGFEEERRVFYVAITRAKDQLYLISPALIQRFGGEQTVRISEFVSELNSKVYKKASVKFNPKGKKEKPQKAKFLSAADLMKKTDSEPKKKDWFSKDY